MHGAVAAARAAVHGGSARAMHGALVRARLVGQPAVALIGQPLKGGARGSGAVRFGGPAAVLAGACGFMFPFGCGDRIFGMNASVSHSPGVHAGKKQGNRLPAARTAARARKAGELARAAVGAAPARESAHTCPLLRGVAAATVARTSGGRLVRGRGMQATGTWPAGRGMQAKGTWLAGRGASGRMQAKHVAIRAWRKWGGEEGGSVGAAGMSRLLRRRPQCARVTPHQRMRSTCVPAFFTSLSMATATASSGPMRSCCCTAGMAAGQPSMTFQAGRGVAR